MVKNYFVHESSYVDENVSIGENTKIWHFSHIMSNCKIGNDCNIGQNVVISPQVQIGDRTKIQNNVSVYTGVICEEDVFIGPSVVFTNVLNPRSEVNRKTEYQKTFIQKGATLGANSTIVCGITIGKYAFVGAGTVVIKNISDFEMVVGNPAKRIGWMSKAGEKLHFDSIGNATCSLTGEKYQKNEQNIVTLL